MKNYFLVLALLLFSTAVFSQKTKITDAEKQVFFSEPVTKNWVATDATGRIAQRIDEDNSFTVAGQDGSGNFKISIIIASGKNKKGEAVETAMLINRITGEKQVWNETEKAITTVVNGKEVIQTKGAAEARGSFKDCLAQHLKPGITACAPCATCTAGCMLRTTKAKRRACVINNCNSKCAPCVTSFWAFISCLF